MSDLRQGQPLVCRRLWLAEVSAMRPRGFADWQPRAAGLQLVTSVKTVLDEYSAHLPLTLRQIFYRLVGTGVIGKTEKDYKRLCEHMNRARRAELIPMDAIRDDGTTLRAGHDFDDERDLRDYLMRLAGGARMDLQRGQPERLELWCEAGGMVPQLERIARPYGITVLSSGGFDSLTAKYETAERYAGQGPTLVLHCGDYDPSGVHIFSSLEEDICDFVDSLGGSVAFERVLVLPEHIEQHNLETAPPKKTDNRSFGDHRTVQAEAFAPDVLARIVEAAITDQTDTDTLTAARQWQGEVRRQTADRIRTALS